MTNYLSFILSLVALGISGIVAVIEIMNLYYDWFYMHSPNIQVRNEGMKILALALPYERLPQAIRNHFPDIPKKNPNYALFSIVIANSGLRVGFVRIRQEQTIQTTPDFIRIPRYNHIAVAPHNITTYQMLCATFQQLSRISRSMFRLT